MWMIIKWRIDFHGKFLVKLRRGGALGNRSTENFQMQKKSPIKLFSCVKISFGSLENKAIKVIKVLIISP